MPPHRATTFTPHSTSTCRRQKNSRPIHAWIPAQLRDHRHVVPVAQDRSRHRPMDTDEYTKQFEALDPKWEDPAVWVAMMQSPGIADIARNRIRLGSWQRIVANKNDVLAEEQPEDFIYTMLYRDLSRSPHRHIAPIRGAGAEMLRLRTARLTASRSSRCANSFSTSTRTGPTRRSGGPSRPSLRPTPQAISFHPSISN
jgi:hypothetical protein